MLRWIAFAVPSDSVDIRRGLQTAVIKGAAEWLRMQCAEIGLSVETLEPVTGKPIILARLIGLDTSLGIVLTRHYDVVPVIRDQWCCDPFAAELRDGYGDGHKCPLSCEMQSLRFRAGGAGYEVCLLSILGSTASTLGTWLETKGP